MVQVQFGFLVKGRPHSFKVLLQPRKVHNEKQKVPQEEGELGMFRFFIRALVTLVCFSDKKFKELFTLIKAHFCEHVLDFNKKSVKSLVSG